MKGYTVYTAVMGDTRWHLTEQGADLTRNEAAKLCQHVRDDEKARHAILSRLVVYSYGTFRYTV